MKFLPTSRVASRWLLLVSLCCNVALAAYVSAQWMRPGWSPETAGATHRVFEQVAARLPKDDADVLWRLYRAKEAELQTTQAQYTRALLKTMQVVAKPELDKDALRMAVGEARGRRSKINDIVIDTFVDMLEQISPEGRRQLVGRFLR